MKQRILGIDTGTNSLGWAVVDRNEDSTYTLVRQGTLIFPEGVKTEKGIESSKAAERTQHRSLRKQYFRRRLRKIETLKVLIKYDLCPRLSDEELHVWHVRKKYPMNEAFLQWQRTDECAERNPYADRHRCLHETLDMEQRADRYVLGRAFYHLTQRRGFLSNRLDASEDDKEAGKVKTGISSLSQEMQEGGFSYLGDYFYWLYTHEGNRTRIRSRYTDRNDHYKKEFEAICVQQRLPDEWVKELRAALYFQRPLKSQKLSVGKCKFEPNKPRCIESHPDFEEFRMLQLVNNIKIKTPKDDDLRPLDPKERAQVIALFGKKKRDNFDFEEIAKTLAGKKSYAYYKEVGTQMPYLFNYRMELGVPDMPVTAAFRGLWGDDWKEALAETYTRSVTERGGKSVEDIVTDVWNVLYSFSSQEKLREFAQNRLQMDEKLAEKFAKMKLGRGTASISLKAVRKILPYLREGWSYTHAVFLANLKQVVPAGYWEQEDARAFILDGVKELMRNFNPQDTGPTGTLDFCIKDFLRNNLELAPGALDKLYHPSQINPYTDALLNPAGIPQLGSPATSSVRNPMAMRSLHQLRHLVNRLLVEGTITPATEIHVEYARELNDANRRKALADYNKDLEKKRKRYRAALQEDWKRETGRDIEPTARDLEKYLLWEEQGCTCPYTGQSIGITDFVGEHPRFDIEHTIPRSAGGDNTLMNKTLCDSRFNREVKGTKLPSQLSDHEAILKRIEPWQEKLKELNRKIAKCRTNPSMLKGQKDSIIQKRHRWELERDYWRGKYECFTMTEVPEGFSRRQGVGIGLISKYAGMYLETLFKLPQNPGKRRVHVVKGVTTAEFRQMWGLQGDDPKSRDNHVHHCIDAIVIACIGKREYDAMAQYYREKAAYDNKEQSAKPRFPKPWPTFTEDVQRIAEKVLVPHVQPDVLGKHTKKQIRINGAKHEAQGDTARGCLHLDTYYGAIMRDGELHYVVRKTLADLKDTDVDKIVDDTVRGIVKAEIERKGLKEALAEPICMNREKGVYIKKVRVYCPNVKRPLDIRKHRDVSDKAYKQTYHVMNESNYVMAIYEGMVKGKPKREFELVNYLDASRFYKRSMDRNDYPELVPLQSKNGYSLLCLLRMGVMVLLWEKGPDELWELSIEEQRKRLYKVVGLSALIQEKNRYGTIELRHHQEARPKGELKVKNGVYKSGEAYRPLIGLLHTQFHALIEGVDFELTILGEIRPLKR